MLQTRGGGETDGTLVAGFWSSISVSLPLPLALPLEVSLDVSLLPLSPVVVAVAVVVASSSSSSSSVLSSTRSCDLWNFFGRGFGFGFGFDSSFGVSFGLDFPGLAADLFFAGAVIVSLCGEGGGGECFSAGSRWGEVESRKKCLPEREKSRTSQDAVSLCGVVWG